MPSSPPLPSRQQCGFQQVCCIPVASDSANLEEGIITKYDCRYLSSSNHLSHHNAKMFVQPGLHGNHAIASQDIKEGSTIVQNLPLAHSLLIPPGALIDDDDEDDGSGGRRQRHCTRCFYQEGKDVSGGRKKNFGRCSKCRVAHYCSRSCQADDWIQQHKLECQYFVKRRKQSKSLSFLHATSAEEDAIPLLLRTFSALKFLRDGSLNNEKDQALEIPAQCATGDSFTNDGFDEKSNQSNNFFVSCGPCHFSSLMVSPEYSSPSFHAPFDANLNTAAMDLAKDLMLQFAIGGSKNRKEGAKIRSGDKIDAALQIWGYDVENCNTAPNSASKLDYAIRRTLNAFQKNNFGIVNSLHAPVGEGVYPCAALLNHSCAPNCILRYVFGREKLVGGKNGQGNKKETNAAGTHSQSYYPPTLEIVACRDILKGEELTHSYVDLALCTKERQERLRSTHGFVCECKRCQKGGCSIDLPEDKRKWNLWPLTTKFDQLEKGTNVYNNRHIVTTEVDIEVAIAGVNGLTEAEQSHIFTQSMSFQEKANQCMLEENASGELENFGKALQLFEKCHDRCWISPFHHKLYSVRCSYLSALLANGQIQEAAEQCEHVVSYLAICFSHVKNHHPLLGLQLYTLGDLYTGAASTNYANDAKLLLQKKAKFAYGWARHIMLISHGAADEMVQTLNATLAELGTLPL